MTMNPAVSHVTRHAAVMMMVVMVMMSPVRVTRHNLEQGNLATFLAGPRTGGGGTTATPAQPRTLTWAEKLSACCRI